MGVNVGVVLLNYNGYKDTIECISSVLNSSFTDFTLVIVDNASPNNSMKHIAEWCENGVGGDLGNKDLLHCLSESLTFPLNYQQLDANDKNRSQKYYKINLIQSPNNGGFAAGNNIGIKFFLDNTDVDYIWLLNNDTVIESNSLNELVCFFGENKNKKQLGVVGSKLRYYDRPNILQACGGAYNPSLATTKHIGEGEVDIGQYDNANTCSLIDYPVGASMFVSREFIVDVGYMCEDYFLYYEEIDWALRGRGKGWGIDFCWDSLVYHKEGRSIGGNSVSTSKSLLSDRCYITNKVKITRKFYPEKLILVKLTLFVTLANRIKRLQFERIPLVLKAIFG
jgi:GT2 family glycosyltransferase